MNWQNIIRKGLVAVASIVGGAGAVVLLPEAAVPTIALVAAKHIIAWGTLVGVVAAGAGIKGMNSLNTPKPDSRGQVADREDPK